MAESEAQVTGLTSEGRLTPAFMRVLFLDGVLGTKEFRSWLALNDNAFNAVRDADVDNEIDTIARERQASRLEEERRYEEAAQPEADVPVTVS